MSLLTALGLVAAILTTGAWLPQLMKCWRTRSTGDISWAYLAALGAGATLWMVYGFAIHDLVVVSANGVTLGALATLVGFKLAFGWGARPTREPAWGPNRGSSNSVVGGPSLDDVTPDPGARGMDRCCPSYPIEVLVNGHTLRATRSMGEIFIRTARINVASPGCPLTVLAHSGGVELLNITHGTPIVVRDLVDGRDLPLWKDPSFSPTIGNGLTMNDLKERIVSAAYGLFAHHPVHEVTREQVLGAAGVTPAEFDSEFGSLDALAEACLTRRERDWTIGLVRAGVEARTDRPEEQLLAIFDVFDEWFHRRDFEACMFVNVLLEMGKDHPLGRASVEHLTYIRGLVAGLAADAGLADPEEFAYAWHILMKGAIINAVEGDGAAAKRAQAMGRDLIARHSRTANEAHEAPAHQLDPREAVG